MEDFTTAASDVISREGERIGKDETERRTGLAFSGGGIRSASFGMGVMQALVNRGRLEDFDYLSTVSGGGYLGSSLTYFLSQRDSSGAAVYGTSKDNFPFGRKRQGGKVDNSAGAGDGNHRTGILNFIRQHGNYLIPGRGLNVMSLAAVVLRTIAVSFAVYFALAVAFWILVFESLETLSASPQELFTTICYWAFLVFGGLWIGLSILYSLLTFRKKASYKLAVAMQRIAGALVLLILLTLVISSLPLIHSFALRLEAYVDDLRNLADGGSVNSVATMLTVLSTGLGSALAFLSYCRQLSPGKTIASWQVVLGSAALLFAILYGSFVLGLHLSAEGELLHRSLVAGALLLGLFCNVNYFGLNRMYRDRLMEAFMPDEETIRTGEWSTASTADRTLLHDMCSDGNSRPYHLINCNVVLVGAKTAKYRARRGDSFVLSPLFCGSDATGWRRTSEYMRGVFLSPLTLATAMSISAAAANPDAGVAGRGASTNQFVSTFMSVFNLRLGFWATNPRSRHAVFPPNYLYPAMASAFAVNGGLTEDSKAVELSDGGHFENLAVYELLRRRLDLIVVSDAGCDGDYAFADLANLVERAKVDFGTVIAFEKSYRLEAIVPSPDLKSPYQDGRYVLSERAFAIARIEYAAQPGEPRGKTGTLVYIKPALIEDLTPDIIGYKLDNPAYPHETTLDQFFDERQFEAYRELGYQLVTRALESDPQLEKYLDEGLV